jgi:hypothetical protein
MIYGNPKRKTVHERGSEQPYAVNYVRCRACIKELDPCFWCIVRKMVIITALQKAGSEEE